VAGLVLFALALAVAVISIWVPEARWPAVIFVLLGMQAFGATPLLDRIANQQAALDMKRLSLNPGSERQKLEGGTIYELTAGAWIKPDRSVVVEYVKGPRK
jgi:hypothetical protein